MFLFFIFVVVSFLFMFLIFPVVRPFGVSVSLSSFCYLSVHVFNPFQSFGFSVCLFSVHVLSVFSRSVFRCFCFIIFVLLVFCSCFQSVSVVVGTFF